ncbi:MAG: RagB/SusD family nutrient uptake outer membrane protein, partial [Cyclobacteriaceae bacterium]|nr:RagB/SusD family nutrient uptake outer membrane protein [Cyclobacteriaceae bacterium]
EFVMEGTRYYDLIRWGTAEDVIPSLPELQNRVFDPAKNYLWPIPQSAIDSNPTLITQNPGY